MQEQGMILGGEGKVVEIDEPTSAVGLPEPG